MGVPLSVTRALDDYIQLVEEPREPDGKYHPSQFWICARQTVYAVRGVEGEQPDAQSKRRFKIGHTLHELIQASMTYSPDIEEAHSEFKVDIEQWNITGHGDALLKLRLRNGEAIWIVVEIKSIRKNGFRYLKGGPKEDHLGQASLYAVGARDFGVKVMNRETGEVEDIPPLGDALKGILFVYFEKEDLNTAEFFVDFDPAWRTAIRQRVEMLDQYRLDESGESLPPRLPMTKGKKHWACGYCPFAERCWKPEEAAVKTEVIEIEHW